MTSVRHTRVFKSGNSKAVRLPADWPLAVGDEVVLRQEDGRIILEPRGRRIDLGGIAGSMPWLRPLSPEDRVMEERDLPWDQLDGGRGG
jgi:antitoxin VapB